MPHELQRITTTYVDVEDRLRLTGVLANGTVVQLWLTQRRRNGGQTTVFTGQRITENRGLSPIFLSPIFLCPLFFCCISFIISFIAPPPIQAVFF